MNRRRPTMRASLLAAAIAAAVPVACSKAPDRNDRSAATPVPIRTSVLAEHRFVETVELAGSLQARRVVDVGADAAGRVLAVFVHVGDHVAAGTTLARIDDRAYRAEFEQAEAGIVAARGQVEAARARLRSALASEHLAAVTAARMTQLYERGAIARQQYDRAQADLAAARAGVTEARAGVHAAEGMVDQAGAGARAAAVPLDETSVTAPFDGIVVKRFVQAGAVVGPGAPVVELEDPSDLTVDLAVPNGDVAALHAGTTIVVHIDAAERTVTGRIEAIVPSENPALRSAMVRIAVPSAPDLMPGMYARVELPRAPRDELAIPAAALAERAGVTGVFAVRGSVVRFVPVTTEAVHGSWISIATTPRLPPGSRLAITGVARLTDGTTVRVNASER
jgi:RND family efflux transporter MFP subunit